MEHKLRTKNLSILLICNTIGAGVFMLPNYIVRDMNSKTGSLMCWGFAAVMALLFGLCYAELGATFPHEGGDVVYFKKAYGDIACFIFSIVSVFAILPLGCALMTKKICQSFNCTSKIENLNMLALLFFFVLLNMLNTDMVIKLQYLLTILKMIVVTIFVVLAFLVFFKAINVKVNMNDTVKTNNNAQTDMFKIIGAFYSALWSFDGWNAGNFIGHKIHNPARTFPRSILICVFVVAFTYVLINLSYFRVLPFEIITQQGGDDIITNYFKYLVIHDTMRKVMTFCVNVIPPLGTLNGSFLVGTSIIDSLIQNNDSKLVLKGIGVSFFGILVFMYGMLDNPVKIVSKISFCVYIFYGMSIASILILRKKEKNLIRGFTVPKFLIYFCVMFSALVAICSVMIEFSRSS